MILHHAETWEGCRTMTNDERRSIWAGGYYGAGYHRDDYTDEASAEASAVVLTGNANESL